MSQSKLLQLAKLVLVLLVVTSVSGDVRAEPPHPGAALAKFVTIVLGAAGGLSEDNLTSYLVVTNFFALSPRGDCDMARVIVS